MSVTGDRDGIRLVVLGADGFIGSHVVREAVTRGIRVRAICAKDPWRLQGLDPVECIAAPEWWRMGPRSELSRWLSGAEALALLSYAPPSDRAPAAWRRHELDVNVQAVGAIAELASDYGLRVVLASTSHVYGLWHEEPVTEATELRPASPYAEGKLRAEDELRRVAVGGWCLRLGTVFGPGEDGPRAVPSFIRALLSGERPVVHGDGTDLYDYVHVRDVARAFVAACLDAPHGDGAPVNIGSGVGRSTLAVLQSVGGAFGRTPSACMVPSPRGSACLVLCCDRARRELGFIAREPFDAGVIEEAAWIGRLYGVPVGRGSAPAQPDDLAATALHCERVETSSSPWGPLVRGGADESEDGKQQQREGLYAEPTGRHD